MKEYNGNFYKLMYNENDLYIKNIISTLDIRTMNIAEYFGIKRIEKPMVVKIYYSIESFKEYLIPFLQDKKYYDWMIMSTHDGNINILSIDCCKMTESHCDITLEEYLDDIMHEVVHKMHHTLKGNNKTNNGWFHESLATNLSGQKYSECEITCTLDELKNNFNEINNSYSIAYTLGKYLLENYPKEFILSICKDESILDEFAPNLFEEVIRSQKNKSL